MKGKILLAAISTFMLAGCGGVISEVKNANIPFEGMGQYKIGDVLDSRKGCDVTWEREEHKGAETVLYTCTFFDDEAEERVNTDWERVLAAIDAIKQERQKDTRHNDSSSVYYRSDRNFEKITKYARVEFVNTVGSTSRGKIFAQFAIENDEVRLTAASKDYNVGNVYDGSMGWQTASDFYQSMISDNPLTHVMDPLTDAQIAKLIEQAERR